MKLKNLLQSWLSVITFLIICLSACSTMTLKQYPEPSDDLFDNSKPINGVVAFAQPLLDENESKDYFGVNLIKNGILAIYLSIRNQNQNTSFTIPAEAIHISEVENNASDFKPEQGHVDAARTASIASAILMSPLLFCIGIDAQQYSNASIIKENFEAKRFRTKTIDPGQKASGFSYFEWKNIKDHNKLNICFSIIDPLVDKTFSTCQIIHIRR